MPKILRSACLAAGLLTLALAGLSPAAQAGTYKQYTCKLPDGSPAGTDGWGHDATAPFFTQADSCDQNAGLRIQMEGVGISAGVARAWHWAPAPNTSLLGGDLYRAFSLTTGGDTGTPTVTVTTASSTIEREGSHPVTGTGVSSRGSYASWNLPANHVAVPATDRVSAALGCEGTTDGTCPATGGLSDFRIQAAHFTLLDDFRPSVSNIGGSLTTAGDKQGIQTLSFTATDAGAGIYRTFLDVDGRTIATSTPDVNGGKCVDAVPTNTDPYEFQHRVPCPLAPAPIEVPLDTRTLADGVHTVHVRVQDAAGNETSAFGPTEMTVRNANAATPTPVTPPAAGGPGAGAPTSPIPAVGSINGLGGGAGARLSVVVLRSNQRTVRVSYGHTVTVSGRLTTPSGDPVSSASVDVLAQVRLRGAKLVRIATVRTDRAGGFRFVVPAGPSRLIRFAYRARVGDAGYAHTTDIDVRVGGKVSMRVSRSRLRNGQTLRYSGTVAGVGARRPLVQIQVRQRGRWINVCVVRTKSRGAYSCSYRFQRTFTPTTYTFRALVRKQEGLPYEADASPRRSVRVRP